jgi:putative Mg2+ transporter-C (MgtC) family protein
MVLGINRDLAGKPIGARTLGLVGLGAALVSLAVTEIPGIAQTPDALARVVQGAEVGALTGIGFLGAGVILRNRDTRRVENLTTAATIWATAALGLAAAVASWKLFGTAAVLVLLLLLLERPLERFSRRKQPDD